MNKDFYIGSITKTASASGKAKEIINGLKGPAIVYGGGAGLLGSAYLLSGEEGKGKIKKEIKSFRQKSKEYSDKDKWKKRALKGLGIAVGTGLSLKKGNSVGSALSKGGLAGLAIGDIAGVTALPIIDLNKKHKAEFGEAADLKSVGQIIASNALPTTAMWGAMYGIKNGIMKNKIADGIRTNTDKAISSAKEISAINNYTKATKKLPDGIAAETLGGIVGDKSKESVFGTLNALMALMPVTNYSGATAIPAIVLTPDALIQKKKEQIAKSAK